MWSLLCGTRGWPLPERRTTAEQLQQPVALVGLGVGLLGVQRRRHLRRRHAIGHELTDLLHLFVRIVDVEERGRVTQVQIGLLILLLQNFQDAQVAAIFSTCVAVNR